MLWDNRLGVRSHRGGHHERLDVAIFRQDVNRADICQLSNEQACDILQAGGDIEGEGKLAADFGQQAMGFEGALVLGNIRCSTGNADDCTRGIPQWFGFQVVPVGCVMRCDFDGGMHLGACCENLALEGH